MGATYVVEMFGKQFTINEVAFTVFGFDVYWYGILIALGFLGALLYAFRRAPDFGIKTDPMIDVVLAGTVGAVVGARLYYVLTEWEQFSGDLMKIIDLREGGLAIYGGVIGAFLLGGLMCKLRKVNVFSMFDLAGIGFLFGQAVGRWGNFANQEAFGTNTTLPWGMYSNGTAQWLSVQEAELYRKGIEVDPSMPVHPCFLYESIWCLLGFVLLHFYSKHRRFKGEMALAYITWYGLGRFFIEGLRTDSLMVGSIRISQFVAALCVLVGGVLLLVLRRKYRDKGKEEAYVPVYDNIITDYDFEDAGDSVETEESGHLEGADSAPAQPREEDENADH